MSGRSRLRNASKTIMHSSVESNPLYDRGMKPPALCSVVRSAVEVAGVVPREAERAAVVVIVPLFQEELGSSSSSTSIRFTSSSIRRARFRSASSSIRRARFRPLRERELR